MKISKNIRHSLHLVGDLAIKHLIQKYSDELGLVYFGQVDQHDDEHRLVRGMTISPTHRDQHYCVGTVNNYDLVLVQRRDTIEFAHHPTKSYSWVILAIDLRHFNNPSAHVFIDGNHHDSGFYATFFSRHNKLQAYSTYKKITLHTPLDQRILADQLFPTEVLQIISDQFKHLDFELVSDQLFVYSQEALSSRLVLDNLFRAGLWLAKQIDATTVN